MIAYKITNTINGKAYIGITSKPMDERYHTHWKDSRHGSTYILHKAMRKYGEKAFTVERMMKCTSWSELCEHEKALIAKHNTLVPAGYNMTSGGEGISNPSDELRAKMSAIAKARETACNLRNPEEYSLSRAKIAKNNSNAKRILIEINGETRHLAEWARIFGLAFGTVAMRYRRGVRGAALFAPGDKRVIETEINGEKHCLSEWARIAGLNISTVKVRYRAGRRGADLIAPVKGVS